MTDRAYLDRFGTPISKERHARLLADSLYCNVVRDTINGTIVHTSWTDDGFETSITDPDGGERVHLWLHEGQAFEGHARIIAGL